VEGTGFGVRYTTDTGDPLEDAFIWVKPGGESDGTSDSSAPRYDHHCGNEDALQPAPEAGHWFQVSVSAMASKQQTDRTGVLRATVEEREPAVLAWDEHSIVSERGKSIADRDRLLRRGDSALQHVG
jgi:hypothetical protein